MNCVNSVFLRGIAERMSREEHQSYGENFYTILLRVSRLSGTCDCISVVISERLFPGRYIDDGDLLEITGEFRSKNMDVDGRRRLILYVFAQDVQICVQAQPHENKIELAGFLCKPPLKRTTPLGREIADLMLAVNRRYGRADYIPCLVWGRDAVFAQSLRQSDALYVCGRIQSRNYIKKMPDGEKEMTAWEVSCSQLDMVDM
jgi:primosomal replication protein N